MNEHAFAARESAPLEQSRFRGYISKAESVYLTILRVATLLIATGIIAYSGWLLLAGTYNVSRDPTSIHEQPANVTAQEIADMSTASDSSQATAKAATDQTNEADKFYAGFVKRYHDLFAQSFERYKQADDPALTLQQFDAHYVNTDARKQGVRDGTINFASDQNELNGLLAMMKQAAALPTTKSHLATYQKTPRQRVEKKVQKTRMERYCSYFGEYIGECLLYDTRPVEYTDAEVTYVLPKGVFSHQDLFGRYQDNYIKTMSSRRDENSSKASGERARILAANAHGEQQLQNAITAGGSFLALMFFFLLIAIERHQRKIARELS